MDDCASSGRSHKRETGFSFAELAADNSVSTTQAQPIGMVRIFAPPDSICEYPSSPSLISSARKAGKLAHRREIKLRQRTPNLKVRRPRSKVPKSSPRAMLPAPGHAPSPPPARTPIPRSLVFRGRRRVDHVIPERTRRTERLQPDLARLARILISQPHDPELLPPMQTRQSHLAPRCGACPGLRSTAPPYG